IVAVAALAASAAGMALVAITRTWLRTRSVAMAGRRSYCPSPQRYSITWSTVYLGNKYRNSSMLANFGANPPVLGFTAGITAAQRRVLGGGGYLGTPGRENASRPGSGRLRGVRAVEETGREWKRVSSLYCMNDPQSEGHMASHIGRREFLATLGSAAAA